MHGGQEAKADARERYLTLLRSGGSDHPMALLKKAGIDLSQPDTVRAIVQLWRSGHAAGAGAADSRRREGTLGTGIYLARRRYLSVKNATPSSATAADP